MQDYNHAVKKKKKKKIVLWCVTMVFVSIAVFSV